MRHKDGFEIRRELPSLFEPTLVPNEQWSGSVPRWGIGDCIRIFDRTEFRCYNSLDTEQRVYKSLGQFSSDHDLIKQPKCDMAALDFSSALATDHNIALPPIKLNDLFQDYYDVMGLSLTWLIVGFSGASNPRHFDIWHTATWNVLLSGSKEWSVDLPDSDLTTRFVQEAGDLIHIPSGWAHQVEYLADSVCLTGNYIHPTSADIVAERQTQDGLSALANLTRKIAHAKRELS